MAEKKRFEEEVRQKSIEQEMEQELQRQAQLKLERKNEEEVVRDFFFTVIVFIFLFFKICHSNICVRPTCTIYCYVESILTQTHTCCDPRVFEILVLAVSVNIDFTFQYIYLKRKQNKTMSCSLSTLDLRETREFIRHGERKFEIERLKLMNSL